jgi:hypothetical protein
MLQYEKYTDAYKADLPKLTDVFTVLRNKLRSLEESHTEITSAITRLIPTGVHTFAHELFTSWHSECS